eukprot:UN2233
MEEKALQVKVMQQKAIHTPLMHPVQWAIKAKLREHRHKIQVRRVLQRQRQLLSASMWGRLQGAPCGGGVCPQPLPLRDVLEPAQMGARHADDVGDQDYALHRVWTEPAAQEAVEENKQGGLRKYHLHHGVRLMRGRRPAVHASAATHGLSCVWCSRVRRLLRCILAPRSSPPRALCVSLQP